MNIQPLKESDLPAVIELIDQCEELTMERGSIYWIFGRFLNKTSFVAKDGDQIAGILLGLLPAGEDTGFIHELGVLEKYRKQGIATALIDHFAEAVKSLGGERIALTTLHNNERAVQFYENRGFASKEITKLGQPRIWYYRAI